MSPVAAPADRRFRRARIKPARKRGRWTVLLRRAAKALTLAALVLYAVYRGGSVAAHAGVLRIDDIVVRGNARLTDDEVLAAIGGLRGENIVLTDLAAWRRRLLASPWVRDASFRRSLPSTVEIQVVEREPLALGRIGGELYLVDERGAVIDRFGPPYADLDLPIVDGLAAREGGGTIVDAARAELAARLIGSLAGEPDIAARLSQVDVADLHNVRVMLSDDPAVIFVGHDRFLPRLRSYLQLAAALRRRVPAIDYVDLRFEGRIYVRPAGTGR